MLWLQTVWDKYALRRSVGAVGLTILAGATVLQMRHGASYVQEDYGCYGMGKISGWLSQQGWPEEFAAAVALLVTPFIHLMLDLGAREAIANHCLILPGSMAQQPLIHLGGTAFFTALHGWLLWRLGRFVATRSKSSPEVIKLTFPLCMLVPTLYGAAHIRYLIPIIPVSLLVCFHVYSQRNKRLT